VARNDISILQAQVDGAFDEGLVEREMAVTRIYRYFMPIRSDMSDSDMVTLIMVAAGESESFVRETIGWGTGVLAHARRLEDFGDMSLNLSDDAPGF